MWLRIARHILGMPDALRPRRYLRNPVREGLVTIQVAIPGNAIRAQYDSEGTPTQQPKRLALESAYDDSELHAIAEAIGTHLATST